MADLSDLPPGLRAQVEADLQARLDRLTQELRERHERDRMRALFTKTEPSAPRTLASEWLPMTEEELRG